MRLPEPLLRAFSVMRPRIEAERFIRSVAATAAATGHMKKADRDRLLGAQRRQAAGAGARAGAARPRTPEDWARLGARVVYEPKES